MQSMRAWLLCALMVACAAANAATQAGVATLVDGGARVLRGATWYKLVPGARVEDGDIVDAPDHAQVQVEFASGSAINVVGPGSLHVVRATDASAPARLSLAGGWLKAAAKPPGVRLHTATLDVLTPDGIVVMRAAPTAEIFVEAGGARLIEIAASGAETSAHDAKRGEHWSKPADGPYAAGAGAPKAFVDAMPKAYIDALPALAGHFKNAPVLAVDHDITYAEAEPWLGGRDRAAFEKRFASRLRDPAFRRAVEPHVARYPSWDRMLHPEKYAPKPPPAAPAR